MLPGGGVSVAEELAFNVAAPMKSEAHHKTRTLWLTGVLHAFTHLYGVALLPLYLRIQQDLKLRSVEQATLLVTVMGVA